MIYQSTRNTSIKADPSAAVLKGLAEDGGLFVPEEIPELPMTLSALAGLSYEELAFQILRLFLTDYPESELKECIHLAYGQNFDVPGIAPLVKKAGSFYLELFHGRTIAFKDMALSILPHLMTRAAGRMGAKEEIVILTATSGDTGKAALAGFADVPGTRIMVFYPKDGVSEVQKLQMVTQKGGNVEVVGVEGNFDDCQAGVKQIFHDAKLKETLMGKGFRLSSANSINIGRLVPQIVYYIYAYGQLMASGEIREGDEINVCVPTGNFGNILAAFYARQMGLPIKKLISASNENKVLYDFFRTGSYDRNRKFVLTSSPSMDILVSSNLERLIFHISGEDAEKTGELMQSLTNKGRYEITEDMRKKLDCFEAGFATEEDTQKEIRRVYEESGYVLDPHTAVASFVADSLLKEGRVDGSVPMVIASTASPYKFARAVLYGIEGEGSKESDMELVGRLSEKTGLSEPEAVSKLRGAEILHDKTIPASGMEEAVLGFLR